MWPGAGNHSLDGRQQWLRDGGRWQQEEAQQEEQGQGLSSAAGVIVCVCGIVLILYFHINIYNYCHLCDRELSPPLSARPGHAPAPNLIDSSSFQKKSYLSFLSLPFLLYFIRWFSCQPWVFSLLFYYLQSPTTHPLPTSLFPQHKHKKRKKRNNFNKKKLNLSDLPDVNKGSSKMESVVW